MTSGLSAEVEKLIIDHISSVAQLEVLLLLYNSAQCAGGGNAEWSALAVSKELRIDANSAAERLADLCSRGFIVSRGDKELHYHFYPKSSDLERAVYGLAKCYSEQRVSVINLIFSKPLDKIRTFADAFKLKGDK